MALRLRAVAALSIKFVTSCKVFRVWNGMSSKGITTQGRRSALASCELAWPSGKALGW